jgi:Zn-dependent protease with chaperone function
MNFFEQQDMARRRTARLVALFALAVLFTVISVYFVGLIAAHWIQPHIEGTPATSFRLWRPEVLLLAGGGSILVILLGSVSKIAQLRHGGSVIAVQLGGRPLSRSTTDLIEKRLLNVVDEMAIASGTPSPPVYMMDRELGINAFAAGYEPTAAVIGVSRGAAERLSRDELQGVIAHEFSHILSGDMRLNIRLIGLLNGILVIGLIGYFILRSVAYRPVVRSSKSNEGGGIAAILAVGAALVVIGSIGTFFGNLIKAAVSRQREYLADASAVQFTRDPSGISGALRKIGGFSAGSSIISPHAPEASHMFFGRAVTSGMAGLFSTHPPLRDRIKRIDPSWDGTMLESQARRTSDPSTHEAIASFNTAAMTATVLEGIGNPTTAHLELARERLAALPSALREAASEPFGARAVIAALLLDTSPDIRASQMGMISASDRAVAAEAEKLQESVAALPRELRITLIDVALPTLNELSPGQDASFRELLRALIGADKRIDLFEFCLQRVVESHLDAMQSGGRRAGVHYYAFGRLTNECALLLSAIARAGAAAPAAASAAFEAGARRLGEGELAFVDDDRLTLDALSDALDALRHVTPKMMQRLLTACATVVAHDQQVTPREAELLRAIADSLGVPTPPMLPGQRLA